MATLLANKNIGVINTDHNVDETLANHRPHLPALRRQDLKTGTAEELAADPMVLQDLGQHFELALKEPPADAGDENRKTQECGRNNAERNQGCGALTRRHPRITISPHNGWIRRFHRAASAR